MEQTHRRFTVLGRVQGVGFRSFVQSLAKKLRVHGEVWNDRNGSVSGYVSGPDESVSDFLDQLTQGPGANHQVSHQPAGTVGKYAGFSITHTR